MKRVFTNNINKYFVYKAFICLIFFSFFHLSTKAQVDVLAYAGDNGNEKFYSTLELSDGTFLVAGTASNLNWVSNGGGGPAIQTIQINPDSIRNELSSESRVGFIMQLSSDLQTILKVVHFPAGAVEDIRHIKTNTVPAVATGDLFVSGTINHIESPNRSGGYFLAKLNANFLGGNHPTALEWSYNVWATGRHRERQPWDVGGDGKVVYVRGEAYANSWCAIYRLREDGSGNDVVNHWRTHRGVHVLDGSTRLDEWTPAYTNPDYVPVESLVNLRLGDCALRSWTTAEYNEVYEDENGELKQGRWPLDYFYEDSCNVDFPGSTQGMPGYTGYRKGVNRTPYVGGIAVDKLNNDIYFGASYQSMTSAGLPDFEPFVMAYTAGGQKKWWARMYQETPAQSPPDQYVDAMTIDYSQNGNLRALVVVGRQHGNAVNSFWSGNSIVNNSLQPTGANTFNSQFTGTNGNMHLSWLGKYRLSNGDLLYSTYVAGFLGNNVGLAGYGTVTNATNWPNHNAGWANLGDTRVEIDIKTNVNGRVYLLLRTRGFTTTDNAYQQQEPPLVPANKRDSWGDYVVVYEPDLRTVVYSSMLTGEWNRNETNPVTGSQGGSNTDLVGLFPAPNGVVVVGYHHDRDQNGNPDGNNIPFQYQEGTSATPTPALVPPWGKNATQNNDAEDAIIAYLTFSKTILADFSVNPSGGACVGETVQFNDLSFANSGVSTWSWDFGAGASPVTSTAQNPSVQWSTSGEKTVTLTVTSPDGTSQKEITYYVNDPTTANFTFSGPTNPSPTTLNFVGPTGTNLTYLWEITDPVTGTVSTYDSQNPSHEFLVGGTPGVTYPVRLTVSNGACESTTIQNITITGGGGPTDPSFTMNGLVLPPALCVGETVVFEQTDLTNTVSWRWFFGTGAFPSSATTPGPHQVVFTQPGLNTALLTVSNGEVNQFYTINFLVEAPPLATFSVGGNTTTAPTSLAFLANTTESGATYEWNFGEGQVASGASVNQAFSTAGTYVVGLTVTSANGCQTTHYQEVEIGDITQDPRADFFFAPSGGACINDSVTVSQVATGGFIADKDNFYWDFGADADPPTFIGYVPPLVKWSTSGTKVVTLRIGTDNGQEGRVKSQLYEIYPYPIAEFAIDTARSQCQGALPYLLSFIPIVDVGNNYFWDFDYADNPGLMTSESSQPTDISFDIFKEYVVYLEVVNNGCRAVSVQKVNLSNDNCELPDLSAGISIEPSREGCATQSYVIRSVSTGSILETGYQWSGISATGSGPHFVSGLSPGDIISLMVTDVNGNSDQVQIAIPD